MTATAAGQPAMDPDNSAVGAGLDNESTLLGDTVAAGSAGPAASAARRIAELRARLVTPMPDDRLWGWIGPLIVTLFAGFLRLYRLTVPHAIMFDETYYIKDAWSILKHGVEWNTLPNPTNNPDLVNNMILAGHTNIFAQCTGTFCGEYVVQPPVGKLLIAVGEWMFGLTTLGWRLPSAVIGTLAVLVMCRLARRMTRSTLLGCVAGLLLALDGLEFVLSRIGILDIFLMFFVLAAFAALVVDRDVSRSRLAERMVLRPGDDAGPELGIRKWRVAAGVLIGLACASKQDAVWYLIAFVFLCVAWDMGARRVAGLRDYARGALLRDGKWLWLTLGVIPLATYIATWSGWLITSTGYDRNYAADNGGPHIPVISALYSLFTYHKEMVHFGVTLTSPHPYKSQPWTWFFMSRPVSFDWRSFTDAAGQHLAAPKTTGPYVQEVLALGNPAIWWVSVPALLFCLGWWLTRRDWRAGVAVLGVLAGWATWLPFMARTKFYYYALEFEPFMILCIVLCLGLLIGPATASLLRRAFGSVLAGGYVLAALILFWYFYPILSDKVIPYSSWLSHMWYAGWI
jgi:dolichyl-phosphate-mannose--protein O-mannosyl transferase